MIKAKDSLIEKIMGLKSPYKNSILLYEYLVSIFIAGGLWGYYTISLCFFCYRLAEKYNFHLSGLSTDFTYFGKFRDFSDYQWKHFRGNLFLISLFALIFIFLSQCTKRFLNLKCSKFVYLITGIGFSYFLHGNKIIFLYIILIISFSLCKLYSYIGNIPFTILTWVFCIAVKILSEIYNGFSLSLIGLYLPDNALLDWNLSFGLNMLKIISFNMEYKVTMIDKSEKNIDSCIMHSESGIECDNCKKGFYCERGLKKYAKCQKNDFTFINLIIYMFYPPLYISGPIILFNSFMFQMNNYKQNKHNLLLKREKILYFIRYIFDFLFFEFFNHYVYVNCFLTNRHNKWVLDDESNFDYFYLALLSFNNLTFLWLKFLVIWRTARVWAWFDGIYTEENMNRCVYNNYCFEGFWRAWHKSYNSWIIRYIYIPLGGQKTKEFNMWIVFSFVALWHDLKLNLLIWGWFICLFFVPEIKVKKYFSQEKLNYLHQHFLFRLVKYSFCSIYIMLMIIANLIGFGMGSEGVTEITMKILKMTSPIYFIKILIFLIPSTVVMFYVRDKERITQGNEKVNF